MPYMSGVWWFLPCLSQEIYLAHMIFSCCLFKSSVWVNLHMSCLKDLTGLQFFVEEKSPSKNKGWLREGFHVDTVSWLRNRVKIDAVWKCLHGTVFARKSKSCWYKRALHYVLNSLFWIERCKFRAEIVTVFKSMWFRCLRDRWNRIVLKTLHFWQLSYSFGSGLVFICFMCQLNLLAL